MKRISFILILALIGSASLAQSTSKRGKTQIYQVKSDKMIVANQSFGTFTDCLWVETDETQGKIILSFEGIIHPAPPKAAYLILNIPNEQDAQSATGLTVNNGDMVVGSIPNAQAETYIYIALNILGVNNSQNLTLTLIGGGPDGLAIASKASGFGAMIQFEY
ncbi:MAG: hypothetical protein EHM93_11195 [Bacteroidales bacterium]|nr:MAG: hypothetical protein EHM93_11195 [Bacteroidales bacterium]